MVSLACLFGLALKRKHRAQLLGVHHVITPKKQAILPPLKGLVYLMQGG